MTQDKNQGSENLSWMEIADADATNEARHRGQRLPFIAAAISLVIIAGGVLFAQASNESPAQAEDISATQSPITNSDPAISASAVPAIPNVAPSAGKYGDHDKYEDRDDDEEEDDD
jgi:hypothetical protein